MQTMKIHESLIIQSQPVRNTHDLMDAEGQCKIASIQALKLKLVKAVPLVFLAIITIIPAILLLNSKRARKYIIYTSCDFDEADHLYVQTEEGTFDLVALNQQYNVKTFIFQQLKYKLQGSFYVPTVLEYDKYLNSLQVISFVKSGLIIQQANKCRQIYGRNAHQVEIQNYFSYMLSVIFQPLYILQYIVVLSLTAQGLPLFGIILVLASWITTSGNYIALYLGKKKIREMAMKTQTYKVTRNGKLDDIDSEEIVPGDLILILKGSEIQCDCALIQGEVFVDQSSLTGQNIPIKKSIYQKNPLNKQNWLYDGTKILEAKDSLAVVIFTGFSSKKGRLLRKILYRLPSQPDFFMKMFFFLLQSFLIAISLYSATLPIRLNADISKYIVALRVLDYLISSVPPAFPVYFTVAYSWSLYRLKKKNIYSTMPQKTVESNRLKSVCFDKTGTLTANEIRLKDICLASSDGMKNITLKNSEVPQINIIKILFGVCHSVRNIDGIDLGDQVDLKMFEASGFKSLKSSNSLMTYIDQGNNQFDVLVLNQFQSRFQSMFVLVKETKTNRHYILVKGAPEKIHSCSTKKIHKYDDIVSDMSFAGLRTIAYGWKNISLGQVSSYMKKDREDFLKNIEILGIVTFNNALKQDTVRSIQTLHSCGINTRMITGDNIFVAVQIAFQSGILFQDEPVIIIEGKKKGIENGRNILEVMEVRKDNGKIYKQAKNYLIEDLIQQNFSVAVDNDFVSDDQFYMCDQIRVFARILPDNKAKIIQLIKQEFQQEHSSRSFCARVFGDCRDKVAMVGDGANDLMAIKQADIGVGFNCTDAVFSSAFTINTLEDFLYVVKEGKCTTLNILECLRFTLIANYINLTVQILLATEATFLSQTQGIYLNFLIIILVPIFISLTYPSQDLSVPKVKDNFLSWQNQVLVWVNILILVGSLVGCYFFITLSQGFIYNPKPVWQIGVGYNPDCQLVTIIFLGEGLLLTSLGWIVAQGYPFKQLIFKNIILTIILVLNFAAFTVYFFILDPSGLGFLNLVPLSPQKTGICFAIAMGSISLSFVFSLIVQKISYRDEQNQFSLKKNGQQKHNLNLTELHKENGIELAKIGHSLLIQVYYLPIYQVRLQILIQNLMAYRATVNLRVLAGVAKPNPKMGQALGPLGVNMMKFCEQFNKVTGHIRPDVPMKVRLTAFTDRTFKFMVKPPETSWFLHKGAGIQKFTPLPGHADRGVISIQYVYQIAKIKKQVDPELKNIQLPLIMQMIIGQLGTCGLDTIHLAIKPAPIALKSKA